jgi:DNA-binding XRE family transcriptional regulator
MNTTTPPALTPLEALREVWEVLLQETQTNYRINLDHIPPLADMMPVIARTLNTYSWDAATIRQSRIVAGLSQAQLAKALGCNVATVEAWERGHRLPSDDHRNKLTHLFTDQENEG